MLAPLLAGTVGVASAACAGSHSAGHEPVMSDFGRVDTNADGFISLAEFKAQKKDERGFRAADLNHDGRLERKEYFAARSLVQETNLDAYFDDAWITAKVKALLLQDGFLTGLEIHVETRNGVVELSGFVERPERIGRAILLASGVKGVKQVQNDLALKDVSLPPDLSGGRPSPAWLTRKEVIPAVVGERTCSGSGREVERGPGDQPPGRAPVAVCGGHPVDS